MLPPLRVLTVASSWWPSFLLLQVWLVCLSLNPSPCDQQYYMAMLSAVADGLAFVGGAFSLSAESASMRADSASW